MPEFDARDQAILDERIKKWEQRPGPRVGDFVRMPDGTLRRFTHSWGDTMQTTVRSNADHYCASFYFDGVYMEFSGSLDPGIPKDRLELTDEIRDGAAWFFHHGEVGAHRGVQCKVPCRVYVFKPEE